MSAEGKTPTQRAVRKYGVVRVEGSHSFEITPTTRQRAFSCVKNKTSDHVSQRDGMRPRTASMPSGSACRPSLIRQQERVLEHDSDLYTVRMFEVNNKGVIKMRSDSWRSRSTASMSSEGELYTIGYSPAASSSSQDSLINNNVPQKASVVSVLGAEGVGKTALAQQFMTSEYLGGFDTSTGIVYFVSC